jgi:glc operon protein GlcG
VISTQTLSTSDALRIVEAALLHAEELGVRVCVAVVDGSGEVKALARMDGASFLNTTLSTNKARTAAGIGVPTKDLAAFAADDPALLAGLSTQPGIALLPGGLPVAGEGGLAGGIGVAGGPAGEDHPIAEAGLAALASVTVRG